MFSHVSLEERARQGHPLRRLRGLVDVIFGNMSRLFDEVHSHTGRPSTPPEHLLRALLLQTLFSIRSERRLMERLDTHHPEAVIIAIGGNDFLHRRTPDATRANIEAMLEESRAAVSHVALMAIPEPSLGGSPVGRLTDHPLYREIAKAQDVALLPDAVSAALSRAELRADRIHANAAGYAFMAERIADALAERGWLER